MAVNVGRVAKMCIRDSGNSLPPLVLFPLMLLGSALSAMVWAAIPAFFKAYWNTNETLFTLMMNYVAMQVIKDGYGFPRRIHS